MRRSDVLCTYEPDNLFERQVRMWRGYAEYAIRYMS